MSNTTVTNPNPSETTQTSKTTQVMTAKKSFYSGLSGMASGLIATLILHPIEVLKIRMQGDARENYKYSFKEIVRLSRQTGLYNGISANALASMMAWGIFFGMNDWIRSLLRSSYHSKHQSQEITDEYIPKKVIWAIDFFASSFASIFAQVCTNPLWLMKTRMSLDRIPVVKGSSQHFIPHYFQQHPQNISANHYNMVMQQFHSYPSTHAQYNLLFKHLKSTTSITHAPQQQPKNSPYKHLFRGLYHIYKTEGPSGLYKGFSASLLGSTHGSIVMFSYQGIKDWLDHSYNQYKEKNEEGNVGKKHSWLQTFTSASLAAFGSKVVATVVTYPTQVIRTGLQDHRHFEMVNVLTDNKVVQMPQKYGIIQATKDIYNHKGLGGFYRGLSMQIVRASLGNVVVFSCWESIKRIFDDLEENNSGKSKQPVPKI